MCRRPHARRLKELRTHDDVSHRCRLPLTAAFSPITFPFLKISLFLLLPALLFLFFGLHSLVLCIDFTTMQVCGFDKLGDLVLVFSFYYLSVFGAFVEGSVAINPCFGLVRSSAAEVMLPFIRRSLRQSIRNHHSIVCAWNPLDYDTPRIVMLKLKTSFETT